MLTGRAEAWKAMLNELRRSHALVTRCSEYRRRAFVV